MSGQHTSAPSSRGAGEAPHGTVGVAAATVVVVVALDQYTKHLAVTHLVPRHTPHEIVGEWLRFTLTYNPGAAFGMHLGDWSRWIFTGLTFVILGFLVRLFASIPAVERTLRLAIAAVIGGAIGNLIDRFRSPEGVVDFIDVGVGDVRFWTFNIADVAVSCGAVLLVLLLWRYEARLHAAQHPGAERVPEGPATATLARDERAER